ncbi:hypothetical protein TRICI_005264 [Trichomonascus ciferrii]|uniref:Proteasome assembly chaperone 3 n=1 Tax=Trichomonascus ciferrii TaxID=44093 RepID=A0A642UUF6_9ASCO|nr:hypothetical protein TRICI_005264 [Trichomonascus ciferrii]
MFLTKDIGEEINGRRIHVVVVGFEDRISVNVHSEGRIGRMYYVSLQSSNIPQLHPVGFEDGGSFASESTETELFPLPHLTPVPLIGSDIDDTSGRLYSTLIASMISRQSPEENRTVVVGLAGDIGPREGASVTKDHRKELLDIIKLVQQCKVW